MRDGENHRDSNRGPVVEEPLFTEEAEEEARPVVPLRPSPGSGGMAEGEFRLNGRLNRVATAFVVLFVFFPGSPAPARGQGLGVYRGRQGRRVGRVTLPTPPFNPDAGILGSRKGRVHASTKAAPRRTARRGVKTAKRNTAPKMSRKRIPNRKQ